MDWKDGLFGGQRVGWMVTARELWSMDLCPNGGGDKWYPPGVHLGTGTLAVSSCSVY